MKLFLEHRKQTTSTFFLMNEFYIKLWELADFIVVVGKMAKLTLS